MKKIMNGIIAVGVAAVIGCIPSADQINKTALAIGYAAGLVANKTGINDDARNAIVTILNEVRDCVPEAGQSYSDAWTPVIKSKVDALVQSGKIDSATGSIVTSVAIMAAQGVDYLFDVRFPEEKKYADLVSAGVSGAVDGFLAVFKPVNDGCDDCAPKGKKDYDKDAYDWFQKNLKK